MIIRVLLGAVAGGVLGTGVSQVALLFVGTWAGIAWLGVETVIVILVFRRLLQ